MQKRTKSCRVRVHKRTGQVRHRIWFHMVVLHLRSQLKQKAKAGSCPTNRCGRSVQQVESKANKTKKEIKKEENLNTNWTKMRTKPKLKLPSNVKRLTNGIDKQASRQAASNIRQQFVAVGAQGICEPFFFFNFSPLEHHFLLVHYRSSGLRISSWLVIAWVCTL